MATGPVDILIIGTGASGAAAAWRLSEAGFKIVCLEQGAWQRPEQYPAAHANWELQGATTFAFDPNIRGLPEDYPVNNTESDIAPLMFNAVGGSTIHWTAHTPRFHPSDFRVRSLDGVADDWPISYFDLEKYFDLNDDWMGCSGIAGDPANPPRSPRPMPPLPLGPDGERIARGFDKLGWHWWPSDSYINSQPYRGRNACNNCGPNGLGCYQKAKGSTDVTYLPEAIKNGVEVRTNARVFKITVDQDGRANGASYYDEEGIEHHQSARGVIVAANGIGTPRLMLLSKSKRHPDGIANSSGLVGKNLMFHPYAMVTGFFDDPQPSTYQGALGNIIISQQFYETNARRDFVRGYSYQMNRSSGPAKTATGLAISPVKWGEGHHEEFAERFGKSSLLAVISEDLPEERNRVELDRAIKDSNGIPAPKVFYRVSNNTRRLLDHGIRNAERVLLAAGAHRTEANPMLRAGGWHLMGTARMGDDPERSVVDGNCQAHDVDNLFVIDGSVFVTSGAVNPTPTIQAIALRAADYICRERTDLKG
ncbi:MAG: GMC family oxidoreductase [Chloroflexi bacterium]|nr:GMC family oxidoreductase [Chloroflexota bacterium]